MKHDCDCDCDVTVSQFLFIYVCIACQLAIKAKEIQFGKFDYSIYLC